MGRYFNLVKINLFQGNLKQLVREADEVSSVLISKRKKQVSLGKYGHFKHFFLLRKFAYFYFLLP